MPSFKAPQYTKVTNPKTGNQDPSYTFLIEFNQEDEKLSFVADKTEDITLHCIQKCVIEHIEWWNSFIGQFLQSSSKLFAKPYTVDIINKIVKHTLNGNNTNIFPSTVSLIPKNIQIVGGNFIVNWGYEMEPVIIDIPDLDEVENNTVVEHITLPDSNENIIVNEIVTDIADKDINDGVEELNIDEIPVGNNSTDAVLEIDSPVKFYEKQKMKEARLKAKLAVYKAQRQISKYYEKYGSDVSDSDSDSDYETSDEEDGSEDEVQV
jgi:hypothetical protein